MPRPHMFLVDDSGQPFPSHVNEAVMAWRSRLRFAFPGLDDTGAIEVLENAAKRVVRRETRAGALEHLHAYAWTAVRSAAVSRLRLGRERVLQRLSPHSDGALNTASGHHRPGSRGIEAAVLLREMLGRLSPFERRVFRLKAAGFSTREIAARLGRAPSTIDSVHSRTMTKLKRLARHGDGIEPSVRTGS